MTKPSEPPQSDFSKRTNAAMKEAAEVVLERARRHNTPIVLWRDGKVVELDPFSPEFDEPENSPVPGQPPAAPFPTAHSPRLADHMNCEDRSDIVAKADAAMAEAAKDVVERARRHNTPIVLWRDGKVVELDPFAAEFDDPKPGGDRTNDAS